MERPVSPVALALVALALAAALAGCTAAPTYEQRQDALEQAAREEHDRKVEAAYERARGHARDQETRRIVREELERQQPRGLRP